MDTSRPSPSDANSNEQRGDDRRTLRIVFGGGFALFLIAFCLLPNVGPVFRLFSMPSQSMLPTLSTRNLLVVSRASYGYSRRSFDAFDLPITGRWPAWQAARGDLVVFRLKRDPSIFFVKRIIGLPGDEIVLRAGVVSINGQAVPRVAKETFTIPGESKTALRYEEQLPNGAKYDVLDAQENSPYDTAGPFKVPADHYFVLGDHRDNSIDSRDMSERTGVGFVPAELLLGRIVHVF